MNRLHCYLLFILALGVASCSPKVSTLRSPDYSGTTTNNPSTNVKGSTNVKKNKFEQRNIALLLPFQLNEVASIGISESDVKRSALALDFYQGFELGLNELTKKGEGFNLDVLDTRDNNKHVSSLATSNKLNEASIVVGPVFPKEIISFGASFQDKNVLQINPLAATMPSEFNISNLVTLTPTIKAHALAIAEKVAKNYTPGEIIIIYNSSDSDSRLFLSGMSAAIKKINSNVNIVSVSTLAELNLQLRKSSVNSIVAGTTVKSTLNGLIDYLSRMYREDFYNIKLFGHPLWQRFDFSSYSDFPNFDPIITSESKLKTWTNSVRLITNNYKDQFGVNPSDASYKGYDAAIFFGSLINKYGADQIKDNLTKETYNGIFSSYKFIGNDTWGYTNESVSFRIYRDGNFQLQ